MSETSSSGAALRREAVLLGRNLSPGTQISATGRHFDALHRAGRWLLSSGIQNGAGGVARYFDSPAGRYRAVSTEITGYAASALVYLHQTTGEEAYLARARKTALFLIEHCWDRSLRAFPFEHPSPSAISDHHSYFFDCGIIIRGLLAVWRYTREDRLLDVASEAAEAMVRDFHSGNDYHPVLSLPDKGALGRDDRWSRSPGCYQLKAATAWWEVSRINGDNRLRGAFLEMLEHVLAEHDRFLPGVPDQHRVMDRLHAYCYFLEGLSVAAERDDCRAVYRRGIGVVERYLRVIAPSFARCDVYAQLLRARLNCQMLGACPLDTKAASEEAAALSALQLNDPDPRVAGGFAFGRRNGALVLHLNPWATAFALQALDMWQRFQSGSLKPCLELLI